MFPLSHAKLLPENDKIDKCVIMLHGYGADGQDLISLAPILAKSLPHCAFYSPDGPEECEMSSFGRQWFSLSASDPEFKRRKAETQEEGFEGMYSYAENAAKIVLEFIESVRKKHTLEHKQIALMGFSQGTMMALHIGLRNQPEFASVVGFSGALVGATHLKQDINAKPPVLLVHGDMDDMLPPYSVELAEKALTACDHTPEVVICNNLMHSIDIAGIRTAASFLEAHF